MKKDTTYNNSIRVEGDIVGKDGQRYDLYVNGDIEAMSIEVGNITSRGSTNAWNINTGDITAFDINVIENIQAGGEIIADFILCESLIQPEGKKLVCKNLIEKRSTYKLKEVKR